MCFIEWYHCRLPLISFEGPFSSIKRFQGQYVKKIKHESHAELITMIEIPAY